MADAHIAVISVVPSAPTDATIAPATQAGGTDTVFAALLSERVDALAPLGSERLSEDPQADSAAADARDAAPSDPGIVSIMLAALPPSGNPLPSQRSIAGEAVAATAGGPANAKELIAFARDVAPAHAQDVATAETRPDSVLARAADASLLHAEARPDAAPAISATAVPAPTPLASIPNAAAPVVTVAPPIRTPEWRDAVTERVAIFVRDRVQAAELHVNPPELGPVSVRIDVSGSEANIVFGVQHAETRNALTEALPRLAELLAANGIALAGAQVGAEFHKSQDDVRGEEDTSQQRGADAPARSSQVTLVKRGLVDIFV
jgi:flagellar hook-length control protein FliK